MLLNLFLASCLTFLLALFLGTPYINWLQRRQMKQYIREDGPQKHIVKQGTPTLGAFIFLFPIILASTIFLIEKSDIYSFVLTTIILFGIIGGADDLLKVRKRQNEGLTSKQKILFQLTASVLIYLIFVMPNFSSQLSLPWGGGIDVAWFYGVFVVFLFVGVSNATNLTDGLDGLLAGSSMISFLTFAFIAWMQGNESMLMASLIVFSGIAGFLKFNYNPARIFMGDFGSLTLGALMVSFSIILKVEILMLFIGFVYMIETLSVIIQVIIFKLTSVRVFKMSPIHHHFELLGMKEKQIFLLFVSIQLFVSGLVIFFLSK